MTREDVKKGIEKALGTMFLNNVITTEDQWCCQRVCTALGIKNVDEISQFVRVTFCGQTTSFQLK